MSQYTAMTIGLMLVAMLSACKPSPPPLEPEVAQRPESMPAPSTTAEPPEAVPAAPMPDTQPGNMVIYVCDGGRSLTVTYDEYSALVKQPTGSTTLSRAEEASYGGRDAYLGEELSLYRHGNTVQLEIAGKPRICTQAPFGG